MPAETDQNGVPVRNQNETGDKRDQDEKKPKVPGLHKGQDQEPEAHQQPNMIISLDNSLHKHSYIDTLSPLPE
jgi:hypothetical protein